MNDPDSLRTFQGILLGMAVGIVLWMLGAAIVAGMIAWIK